MSCARARGRPMNQFSVDSVRAFELMVQQWHKHQHTGPGHR